MFHRQQIGRISLMVAAGVGAVHFLIGVIVIILAMVVFPSARSGYSLLLIAEAGGLCVPFALALELARRNRMRWSTVALILGLTVSIGAFVYDFTHGRWQINGGGEGQKYFIWWWYYEPFWYGYHPGNV